MEKFGFLLKSFSGDFLFSKRLIESFNKYNVDRLKLCIVVPQADISQFSVLKSSNIELISEEGLCPELVSEPINGIRPGYVNQEIVKLYFWKAGLFQNYMCLDSDGVFLKNFTQKDFMYDQNIPFSILVEDMDLVIDPEYYREHWQGREEALKAIKTFLDFTDPRILTCHGFAIFNCAVLESMQEKLLRPLKLQYKDLIAISPYEFSWYNFWLQKDRTIPIYQKEPLFKYIHSKNQHMELILKGVSASDMARGYLGIVVNSNYSRFYGLVDYDDNRTEILAKYFSINDLAFIFYVKLKAALVRRIKRYLKIN